MSYDYLTPEQMYNEAVLEGYPPKQGTSYYEKKEIGEIMTVAQLVGELNKGRFWILEAQGVVYTIKYTQYYYTETGNLKRDTDSGALVMDATSPVIKTVIITG